MVKIAKIYEITRLGHEGRGPAFGVMGLGVSDSWAAGYTAFTVALR